MPLYAVGVSGLGNSAASARLPAPTSGVAAIERLPEGGRERDGLVPLDRNERLAPLPEAVVEELRAALDSELLTTYPATDRVYDRLADAHGLPREHLLLTPGSDGAHRALHHAYVRAGDEVVMLDPSYRMFAVYTEMFEGSAVKVPFGEDLALDNDALVGAIGDRTRLVLVANPNQPTGTVLGDGVLDAVLARAAEVGALVVVDEAYHPFSGETVLDQVPEQPQLVVTRTFSKAWGLAGLRAGLVAADHAVIANLFKVRSVYDVNSIALRALELELDHPDVATDYVAEVEAGRTLLADRCRAFGLTPLESPTNFMQIRLGDAIAPGEAVERLRERGYLVAGPYSFPCLADCIRVTLGPPALMEQFAGALAEVVA